LRLTVPEVAAKLKETSTEDRGFEDPMNESDARRKDRLFDGLFERSKDNPNAWASTALNLRMAADVLFKAYRESWEPAGEEPRHSENEHLNSPASMLYGCALENAIKGYLIKKHGGFEPARTAHPNAWPKHRLLDLALATGLPLSNDQELCLKSAEAFVRWAGRYPISITRQEFTIPKQFRSGNHMTPNALMLDTIEILEPFYHALIRSLYGKQDALGDLDLAAKS
jgi:hypothetical protein